MDSLNNLTTHQVAISLALLVAGLIAARMSTRLISGIGTDKLTRHHAALLKKLLYYVLLVLFVIAALQQLGVNLGVLLGAAGILSVAIGFASQTSASNIISGLFLLGEKPFGVGDVVRVGGMTGEVLSIDLLSVKLRTFDNLFVRIPNETIIKSEVTTLTRYPIRRFDLLVGVAYKEDLDKVKAVLLKIAADYNLCLEDPEPLYMLQGFGDSSINIQFSVWAQREHFLKFKNGMIERVKKAFDEHQIEIPFPHRTIYTGSATEPFPVAQHRAPVAGEKQSGLDAKADSE